MSNSDAVLVNAVLAGIAIAAAIISIIASAFASQSASKAENAHRECIRLEAECRAHADAAADCEVEALHHRFQALRYVAAAARIEGRIKSLPASKSCDDGFKGIIPVALDGKKVNTVTDLVDDFGVKSDTAEWSEAGEPVG